MRFRRAILLAAATLCVWGVLHAQRPFKQYRAAEYEDFPLPPDWNQKTELSFSQAVEIPGRILPAGRYWFVLDNSPADRNVVQVFSGDWSKEWAILLTIPTYRSQSTDITEVKFAERAHDKPEALLTWYYPGRLTGHEFLYASRHEQEFARDIKQDVEARTLKARP
jgi:hypothetical protein